MASRFLAPMGFGRGGGMQRGGGVPDPFMMLQREMTRLLDDVARTATGTDLVAGGATEMITAPRIDVQETDKELRITAEMPGVTDSDIQVTLQDDVLMLRGEKRQERAEGGGNFYVMERAYGTFQRAIQLPFTPDPDQIQASFRDGILTITIPKQAQQQERTRRIQVSGAGGEAAPEPGGDGQQAGKEQPTAH